ncbi:MAG TPA: hypothetical protein VGD04_08210 [Methylophilus sp.]
MYMYHHHVSGIFQRHADALTALNNLRKKGLPLKRMQLFEREATLPRASTQAQSNLVLKNMLMLGCLGSLVGVGIGALAQVALVASDMTLLFASPWVAPIAMLGWGATVGGTVGAAIGAMKTNKTSYAEQEGWFSELIRDAIAHGQCVLIVETLNKHETTLASEVMQLSANNYEDVKLA